jgi:hypothetical protein
MRALLVLLGILAIPAWVFLALAVDIPVLTLFVAPALIALLYGAILVVISPRAAVMTFMIGFSLTMVAGGVAAEEMIRGAADAAATPGATP